MQTSEKERRGRAHGDVLEKRVMQFRVTETGGSRTPVLLRLSALSTVHDLRAASAHHFNTKPSLLRLFHNGAELSVADDPLALGVACRTPNAFADPAVDKVSPIPIMLARRVGAAAASAAADYNMQTPARLLDADGQVRKHEHPSGSSDVVQNLLPCVVTALTRLYGEYTAGESMSVDELRSFSSGATVTLAGLQAAADLGQLSLHRFIELFTLEARRCPRDVYDELVSRGLGSALPSANLPSSRCAHERHLSITHR